MSFFPNNELDFIRNTPIPAELPTKEAQHGTPDKIARAQWIQGLQPEERENYRKMGFNLHLLQMILKHDHLIALPEKEAAPGQLSWDELITMIEQSRAEIVNFLKKESSREKNNMAETLNNFYLAIQKLQKTATTVDGEKTGLMSKMIDAFNGIPQEMAELINRPYRHNDSKGTLTVFAKIRDALQLSPEENRSVLSTIAKLRIFQKERLGSPITDDTVKDLDEIISAIGSLGCIKRQPTPYAKDREKKELQNLLIFLKSHEDSLRRMKEQSGSELDRESVKAITNAWTQSFSKALFPVINGHHRDTIIAGMSRYSGLEKTLAGINNRALKQLAQRVSLQVGVILSHLEHIWNFHHIADDFGTKKMVYPRKMLQMAPIITKETEKLISALKEITNPRQEIEEDTGRKSNIFTVMGVSTEASSASIALPFSRIKGNINNDTDSRKSSNPGDICEEVIDNIDDLFGSIGEEKPVERPKSTEERFCETLDFMAQCLNHQLKEATRCLESTSLTEVEADSDEEGEVITFCYPSVSGDIQGYFDTMRESLMICLYEIARVFNPQAEKNTIVPEFRVYENQAASLREEIAVLAEDVSEAESLLKEASGSFGQNREAGLDLTKKALSELAGKISRFKETQNTHTAKGEYQATLSGLNHTAINRFIETLEQYILYSHCDNLKTGTVKEYLEAKKLDDFAESLYKNVAAGKTKEIATAKEWLKAWNELKKTESEMEKLNLEGLPTEDKEQTYKAILSKLIENMKNLPAENRDESISIDSAKIDADYFRYLNLMKQFTDFRSVLEMQAEIGNKMLLADHDRRIAVETEAHLGILENLGKLNLTSSVNINTALESLIYCKEACKQLKYVNPLLTREMNDTIGKFTQKMNSHLKEGQPLNQNELNESVQRFARFRKDLQRQI